MIRFFAMNFLCLLLIISFSLSVIDSKTCSDKCAIAGHCCVGTLASCQHPSCAMGCIISQYVKTEAECNNTCIAADKKCTYKVGNVTLQMCGDCPERWFPPGHAPGWWPPGYQLPSCSSCDGVEECLLGCKIAFEPGFTPPIPPTPSPPPPTPSPIPPEGQLNFSSTLGSHMVLQQAPAKAAVYGYTGKSSGSQEVGVNVSGTKSYTLQATVNNGYWKVYLPQSGVGGSYKITAYCKSGCSGSATIDDITFGDVWYCAGQSNMWLPLQYTYHRKASYTAIKNGKYDNIRMACGDSQKLTTTAPWMRVKDAVTGKVPLDQFAATCYYFAESLTDIMRSKGINPPPIGLVSTAIGGSMIEEWVTNDIIANCKKADIRSHNHQLWDNNVRPFLDMTVKGWLWYQGENNCGTLHGNSMGHAGYGCLMPALIQFWRKTWSKEPGTTNPQAPFGIVSLSQADSEGNPDMASFRWSQTGNYGVLPNVAMPNTFLAHGYDIGDPWSSHDCKKPDPRYDCKVPWFMGPGIHPRLKKPVGQRLAVGAMGVAYGGNESVSGPTISGCALSGNKLVVKFNKDLLKGSKLMVQNYNKSSPHRSAFSVFVNGTLECIEKKEICPLWTGQVEPYLKFCRNPLDDQNKTKNCVNGINHNGLCYNIPSIEVCSRHNLILRQTQDNAATWVPVNIDLSTSGFELDVDLTPLAGATPLAIRYAWGNNDKPNGGDVLCCQGLGDECIPASCPIMSALSSAPFGGLPANPFLAKITQNGKCVCPSPQTCDD